ncbi:hypothetical protein Ahy_B05g075669 isoform B [Arachis hypogaea]|uniref:SWIM-type domain-containing protein n=1 Tax=Arachis hypogaea TaxID=3818 RepID=A0A444Z1P9_ARAHY|nr:hypothetical protein Ahy_B05g075669 isoform B [Arachis hypogaea]
MEGTANLRVYYNSEIIPHTHEGEIIPHPFSLVIPCTMTFAELQNNLCRSIQSHISKRVNNILYRNPVILFGKLMQFHIMSITDDTNMQQMFHIYQQSRFQVTMIELYVEFEHLGTDAIDHESDMDEVRDIVWEEDNSDSEDDFEANYEVNDENEDENEYANIGVVAANDGEFSIRMEFSSKESVISAIKNYTISRGVAYTMYAFQPMTLYAKCKRHDKGCDWLIRASLNRKKGYWEIRSYNGRHTCTTGTISQNHFKLDSNMIVDAIRPLVEVNPSLKVKSIIAEVQSKFNYTVSYRKAWLAKQKCVAKIFEFATRRVKENLHRAGNIVVNRFDRHNEVFEVHEMDNGSIFTVNLAQRVCDCGHFQVERLPCRHVLACCANQRFDWQVYVNDVYKMSEIRKVYSAKFAPLGDPDTWPKYKGPKCTLCGEKSDSSSRCPQHAGSSSGGIGREDSSTEKRKPFHSRSFYRTLYHKPPPQIRNPRTLSRNPPSKLPLSACPPSARHLSARPPLVHYFGSLTVLLFLDVVVMWNGSEANVHYMGVLLLLKYGLNILQGIKGENKNSKKLLKVI